MESFEEYIEWRVEKDSHLQSDFFCNECGEVVVDFIGRIETLEKDFEKNVEK